MPNISIVSQKGGVGCSSIAWSLSNLLKFNMYEKDNAFYEIFNNKRKEANITKSTHSIKTITNAEITLHQHYFDQEKETLRLKLRNNLLTDMEYDKEIRNIKLRHMQFELAIQESRWTESENAHIEVQKLSNTNINICKEKNIFDIGTDIIKYIKFIDISELIIIPTDISMESIYQTIATVNKVCELGGEKQIFIVFNKLDNKDSAREKLYTSFAQDFIQDNLIDFTRIKYFYIRNSLSIFRNIHEGNYFLDHYIRKDLEHNISEYDLLRVLRYYSVMVSETKKAKKEYDEIGSDKFFASFRYEYERLTQGVNIAKLYNLTFVDNNRKAIKDILLLATDVKIEMGSIYND